MVNINDYIAQIKDDEFGRFRHKTSVIQARDGIQSGVIDGLVGVCSAGDDPGWPAQRRINGILAPSGVKAPICCGALQG